MLNLLLRSKLNLVEIFRELDKRKLFDEFLIRGQIRHASRRRASVDYDGFPIDQLKQLLVVEELRHQLELKDALASALGARRDLSWFVSIADPERVPHESLLLRVAENLGRVLGRNNVEKFVLGADF